MTEADLLEQLLFKSRNHPGDLPPAYLYVRGLARPLLWCALPVMIVATTVMLMGYDPLTFVSWGMPLALIAAVAWTLFRLTRTVAQIRIADGRAAVYSVWDVARHTMPATGPLLHAERIRGGLRASIGDTVYTLRSKNWPEFEDLLAGLRRRMQ